MIAHQAIGMYLPSGVETSLAQGSLETLPDSIVVENRFAPGRLGSSHDNALQCIECAGASSAEFS